MPQVQAGLRQVALWRVHLRELPQAAKLLQVASPALRKAGLTAVVDVDPQSL